MNFPPLITERLSLRHFKETDAEALFSILKDEETTAFLPLFPLTSPDEAKEHLKKRYLDAYEKGDVYRFAVCLKEDDIPIGEIHASQDESRDLGFVLKKEFWRRGIMTEAVNAVIERLMRDKVPYITATHDIHNPRSGAVMKKAGMRYCYSYEEDWRRKISASLFGCISGIWTERTRGFIEAIGTNTLRTLWKGSFDFLFPLSGAELSSRVC